MKYNLPKIEDIVKDFFLCNEYLANEILRNLKVSPPKLFHQYGCLSADLSCEVAASIQRIAVFIDEMLVQEDQKLKI
ncbi:MAG: hypothetical protein NT145_03730 [Elusimicrobia bacterium]|nr:hypothetical protein [Elusimicrobiota bacterium]